MRRWSIPSIPVAVVFSVLLTGVLTGLFLWNTYVEPVAGPYRPFFAKGRWMVAPGHGPQGYFRKELHVPGVVKRAWVQVAAPDSFVLYLNRSTVASEQYVGQNVSGVYDIGGHLRPGKNVIGLVARRETAPGPAMAVVEGAYLDESGREHRILSDESWRAASVEDSQSNGLLKWNAGAFNADGWSAPGLRGVPSRGEILPASGHPELIARPPTARWIGPMDPRSRTVVFTGSVTLSGRPRAAWLRVAARERYALVLNGLRIGARDVFRGTLDVYDVSPMMRLGANAIEVSVVGQPPHASPRLLLDTAVDLGGHIQVVPGTDSSWIARESNTSGAATVVAEYSPASEPLAVTPVAVSLPENQALGRTGRMLAGLIATMLATVLLWLGSATVLRRLGRWTDPREGLIVAGLLCLPTLALFGTLYLLQFDARLDPTFPFRGWVIAVGLGLWLVLAAAACAEAWLGPLSTRDGSPGARRAGFAIPDRYRAVGLALSLVGLILAGGIVRVAHVQSKSLHHDEVTVALLAGAVLDSGVPKLKVGPIEKTLTTYEALPYPIALSMAILGRNDLAVRLPAIVFSVGVIAVIYLVGAGLWNRLTGFFGALIYTFSPFSLVWGVNAFHPQQTQLLSLVTSYLFYLAIRTPGQGADPRYVYAAAAALSLTYLSWEAAGLLLPALLCGLLAVRGLDFSWIRSKHIWLATVGFGLVVVWQLSRRLLLGVQYIVVGFGLSNSGFTLNLLQPMFDPWFYFREFLGSGIHVVLAATLAAGLAVSRRDAALRYCATLLVSVLVLLANCVPQTSLRYSYFVQPLLILAASAVAVRAAGSVVGLLGERSSVIARGAALVATATLLVTFFLSSNRLVLELDRLTSARSWMMHMLPKAYWIDYRSTVGFLKPRVSDGDAVISLMPHTLKYYGDMTPTGYIQSYTDRQVFYDVSELTPRFLDKYAGNPVQRNVAEVRDSLGRYRRVWVVATPVNAFEGANDRPTLDYVVRHGKVVYESYQSKVYLWER